MKRNNFITNKIKVVRSLKEIKTKTGKYIEYSYALIRIFLGVALLIRGSGGFVKSENYLEDLLGLSEYYLSYFRCILLGFSDCNWRSK